MIETLYKQFRHWSEKGGVYIISDTHFDDCEQNKLVNNWPTSNEFIKNIKKFVGKNDTLIHLGDVGDPKYMKEIRGYKVLLTGNHDKGIANYEAYFNEIYNGPLFISNKILLSHEPFLTANALNIHGHAHMGEKFAGQNGVYEFNVAADVINYTPVSLKAIVRSGILRNVRTLHDRTIQEAVKKASKRNDKKRKRKE